MSEATPEPESTKGTMWWENWRGKKVERNYNLAANAMDHQGTVGFAYLIMAANTHLSTPDVERLLGLFDVKVSRSWIHRRRWMFRNLKRDFPKGPPPNADRKNERAFTLMRDNPEMSPQRLVWFLRHNDIKRSLQWVRMWRHNAPAPPDDVN